MVWGGRLCKASKSKVKETKCVLEKREEKKRHCKEKYETTTINTGTLSVEQRGGLGRGSGALFAG